MKRLVVTLLAVLIVFGMTRAPSAETIKLGTLAPEGSPWHRILRDMGEAWKELSGGRIDLRIYPSGILGDEPVMVQKMRIGQLHAAALSGTGLSKIVPEIQALQMPMTFASNEELDYVRDRVGPGLEAIFEQRGYKLLDWGDAGWVYFFATKPIVHPDDLKSLKLWVWSTNVAILQAWKDAGYQPVPLATTEIHTSLQSGLIEGFTTTPIAALSFQWFALARHMTDLKWAPLVGALVISKRKWDAFPDELKPLLLQAARDAGSRVQQEIREVGDKAIEVMKEHGLVVHQVPPDAAAEWERRARNIYPTIVGTAVPREIVAEVERLRTEYRALQEGQ